MTTRLLCLVLAIITVACRSTAPPAETAGDAEAAHSDAPRADVRTLAVPPERQRQWGLSVERVTRVMVTPSFTLPGALSVNQQRTAMISPIVEGKVVEIRADLGQSVRRNQVLAVIHSPAFAQAQMAFLQSHARLTLARREFERGAALLKAEAIQEKEYLRREAELEAATSEYGLQESMLHSMGLDHTRMEALIRRLGQAGADLSDLAEPLLDLASPIDGRIIFRDATIGEQARPDRVLFTVSDLSTLWVFLDAREKDLPLLTPASRISIRSPLFPDRVFEGRNLRFGDLVDEKLRTVKIRVDVVNAGLLLKPNMYVEGLVQTAAPGQEALAVPERAVQTVEGVTAVFVQEGPATFSLRPIEVGDRVAQGRIVVKGLNEDEQVVVAGAFTLKAELLKSTLGGEH